MNGCGREWKQLLSKHLGNSNLVLLADKNANQVCNTTTIQEIRADANEFNIFVMSTLVLKPLISLQIEAAKHKLKLLCCIKPGKLKAANGLL